MAFQIENLSQYDKLNRQWTLKQILDSIKGLGSVLTLIGRLDNLEALNAVTDPQTGDMYLIGPEGAPEFTEYFRTPNGTWEYMGVTSASIDGYVDEYGLYKGGTADAPGTGTIEAPAEGTILKQFLTAIDTLINTKVEPVSTKVDNLKTDVDTYKTDTNTRLDNLEKAITEEEIKTMFNTNTATIETPAEEVAPPTSGE